ncbi:MAG: hypothetical protein MZV49_08955 [Rhodopseudomonas palustris]|nr:hypothetical protein [Rhodopseudomonas palustris]
MVVGRSQALRASRSPDAGAHHVRRRRRDARDRRRRRCASGCCGRARRSLRRSPTEHFRGCTRLPAFGAHAGRAAQWTAALALASGEPVYGLGEKFGPLDKRGQLIHSQVEDALGVNTERQLQEHAVRAGARHGRAWGVFVHTPAPVAHGVGYAPTGRTAPTRSSSTTRRSTCSCSPARHARADPRTATRGSPAARRVPPLWSLGLWLSTRLLHDAAEEIARRSRARCARGACPATSSRSTAARGRTPRRASLSSGIPARYPDPRAVDRGELKAHRLPDLRLGVPAASRCTIRCSTSWRRKGWLLKDARTASRIVYRLGPRPATFGNGAHAAAGVGPRSTSRIPAAYAYWRDRHRELFERRRRRDQDRLRRAGRADDAVASNGDARRRRLHNVYPLLYNRCVYEATASRYAQGRRADGLEPRRVGRQRSAIPIAVGRRSAEPTGAGSPRSIRGGLSWGMTRRAVSTRPTSAASTATEQPTPVLYRALGCRRPCSRSHIRAARHRRARALGVRRRRPRRSRRKLRSRSATG